MDLSEQIKQYYFRHFGDLSKEKQFHFASRLAAWEGNAEAKSHLNRLKPFILPEEKAADTFERLLGAQPHKRINAYSLRRPFFELYPQLYGIHLTLFRIRHQMTIYSVDQRDELYALISRDVLDKLADDLKKDDDALRILSTYAVNFLYLYKTVLSQDYDYINLEHLKNLRSGYNFKEPKHLQLLIYLYTHCIIGETNFYTREVAKSRLKHCQEMLTALEPLINDRFEEISLDSKLEYLVCTRICGFSTYLFDRIYAECQNSISAQGHFLVDRHNKNAREDRVTFDKSEHRNVLYVMAFSNYSP